MKLVQYFAVAALFVATSVHGAVKSSVFDDVKVWYKGSAGNAAGTADSGVVTKVKSLPHLADASSAMHGGTYHWWGWRLQYQNQKVDCPYAGVSFDSTPCIVVPPAVLNADSTSTGPSGYAEVTINGETTTQPYYISRRYGALYFDNWMSDWAADAVCSNYTCVLRFRSDIVNAASGNMNNIFKIGSIWTSTAGAAAGVALTFNPTNSLSNFVWPRLYVGADFSDQRAYPIKGGRWVDCALVVNGQRLDTWLCWNSGTDETPTNRLVKFSKIYPTTAALPTIKGGCRAFLASSDIYSYGASYTNGVYSSDLAGKAFEGAYHQVAFWDRTLSDDEVREAMAGGTGRPNIVHVGIEGNGIEEFSTSAQTASVSNTGAWENLNPTLTVENPSATIAFTCPALWAGKSQYLRVPMAATSTPGVLSVALNGETLGVVTAKPGKAALLYVPQSKIASGDNALVLTRMEGESLVLDAVTLGGAWRFGASMSSFSDSRYELNVTSSPDQFEFNPGCGSDKLHSRSLNNSNERETNFDFFVPSDLLGKFRGIFQTRVMQTGTSDTFYYDCFVNGKKKDGAYGVRGVSTWTVQLLADDIVAGWNRLSWKTYSNGYWANIDWHNFELKPPPKGLTMLVR